MQQLTLVDCLLLLLFHGLFNYVLKERQILIHSAVGCTFSSMHGQHVMLCKVMPCIVLLSPHTTEFHDCKHDVLRRNSSELNNMMVLQVNIQKTTAGEMGLKMQLVLPNV